MAALLAAEHEIALGRAPRARAGRRPAPRPPRSHGPPCRDGSRGWPSPSTTTASPAQHAPLLPVDGGDGDDVVTVDEPPVGVDRERPVGVAVERDARIGAGLDHRALQRLGMRRPGALVDVAARRARRGAPAPPRRGPAAPPDRRPTRHRWRSRRPPAARRDADRRATRRRTDSHRCTAPGSSRTDPTTAAVGRLGGPEQARAARLRARSSSDRSACARPERTASRRCPGTGCGRPRSPRRARRPPPLNHAAAGVGATPSSTTSTPSAASPAASAPSSTGPDSRVSRAMTHVDDGKRRAAARPSASTNSGVSSSKRAPSHTVGTELQHQRAGPPRISACCTAGPCGPSSGRTSWIPSRVRRG